MSPVPSRRGAARGTAGRAAGPSARAAAITPRRLMLEAELARTQAYAPYSRFAVGAALLTRDGRILHGCNVENASYGLSMCAERAVVFKAVGEGEREFVAIAIAAEPGSAASPCGACRQVLHEFAPSLRVYWRDANGRIIGSRIEQLLPRPFTSTDLTPRTRRAAPRVRASRRARR